QRLLEHHVDEPARAPVPVEERRRTAQVLDAVQRRRLAHAPGIGPQAVAPQIVEAHGEAAGHGRSPLVLWREAHGEGVGLGEVDDRHLAEDPRVDDRDAPGRLEERRDDLGGDGRGGRRQVRVGPDLDGLARDHDPSAGLGGRSRSRRPLVAFLRRADARRRRQDADQGQPGPPGDGNPHCGCILKSGPRSSIRPWSNGQSLGSSVPHRANLARRQFAERRLVMRAMQKAAVVCALLSIAGAPPAFADKLRGFLCEASSSAIVVDGEKVRLTSETKIERPNQKDITAPDLRSGWEVEVDAREEEAGWVARQVKVKDARFQEEKVSGVIDEVTPKTFFVDGDEVRLPKGTAPPPGLKPGMRFDGKGIRLDDRSIELKEGRVMPAGYEGEEAQFMAMASQEVGQIKRQLKRIDDPALQAYVERVGRSLVPKWVDPQLLNFTFTLVADPSLNAFALPDGTVVVHSGLVAALENEA